MARRVLLESFIARGHPNAQVRHRTTLEFTREPRLTTQGDCIAGVSSTLAPAGFKAETKAALRASAGRDFILQMRVGGLIEEITGKGHPGLALDDEHEMVFRKSAFVSGRTVLVSCDKASCDLDDAFRVQLASEGAEIEVSLYMVS
ncbi:MAG: DUF371 domain-containing protein [Candidatus Lokiarchaeota archaeon]|nr:DUF371 domain-containing protein [Candidatus Lokiarchaeota archaeon]